MSMWVTCVICYTYSPLRSNQGHQYYCSALTTVSTVFSVLRPAHSPFIAVSIDYLRCRLDYRIPPYAAVPQREVHVCLVAHHDSDHVGGVEAGRGGGAHCEFARLADEVAGNDYGKDAVGQ